MPRVNRRQFLQFAGSTLTTLGLSQFDIIRKGNLYGQVLAQDTPRKLALLVGINNYPQGSGITLLNGCLNDIEMQRELLLHSFGFNPQDIITLTDEKANRQNILETFENHLIKQAKPGDVVVFHFSGHGSRVIDPNPINQDGLNGTMMPYDRYSPNTRDTRKVRDIMGRTLFLLMYALQTENVTAVIDSCHSGGGTRGGLVVRAFEDTRFGTGNAQASPEEFEYQDKLLSRLKLSPSKFQELRRKGIAKGIALGSAQRDQFAADARFNGFYAGAFSYLLTRYLWQDSISQPVETTFVNLQRITEDVSKSNRVVQVPLLESKPGSNYKREPIYFLKPTGQTAEAVIRSVKNGQIEFWLGGVSSESLDSTKGSIFNLIDAKGKTLAEIEQTSRIAMVGYGKLRSGQKAVIQPGALLRERVRGIPTDLTLRIGIDASLKNQTEIVQAQLQKINRLESVVLNQKQHTNFIFGKMTSEYLQLAKKEKAKNINLPPVGSIGLFSSGLIPIPDTFGRVDEPVDAAINRLKPKFTMLLAGRILRSILNTNASSLKVTADIVPNGARGASSTIASRGAIEGGIVTQKISTTLQTLKPDTEIKVHVTNNENRNLYIAVLVIASNGDIVLLYPSDYDSPEDASLVAPKKELIVPPTTANPQNDFRFTVQGPSGFLELLVLASTEPLRNALRGIKRIAAQRGTRSGDPLVFTEKDSVKAMESLLGDLDNTTRANVAVRGGIRGVDTTQLAALSAIIEVAE
ncbi:MAG: caspase family protein [Rivularia sp. (in: cyanobacteria)]